MTHLTLVHSNDNPRFVPPANSAAAPGNLRPWGAPPPPPLVVVMPLADGTDLILRDCGTGWHADSAPRPKTTKPRPAPSALTLLADIAAAYACAPERRIVASAANHGADASDDWHDDWHDDDWHHGDTCQSRSRKGQA